MRACACCCVSGSGSLSGVSAADNSIICNDKYTFKPSPDKNKRGQILYYETACLAAKQVTKVVGLDNAILQEQLRATSSATACTILGDARTTKGCTEPDCAQAQSNGTDIAAIPCTSLKSEFKRKGCCLSRI